ncbi:DUF202 domain-containing protein [Nocardia sp. NPDC005825]|uniref:DUF202 domain-containing protein n=1 Tax=unclassified Nocardia TaxID=2637762 RepID=UPI00340582FA
MTVAIRDPGAQPERTALAWRRTALASALVATILLRQLIAEDRWPIWAGATVVTTATTLAFLAHRRSRHLIGSIRIAAGSPAVMATVAAAVALAALITLISIISPPALSSGSDRKSTEHIATG